MLHQSVIEHLLPFTQLPAERPALLHTSAHLWDKLLPLVGSKVAVAGDEIMVFFG